MFTCDCGSTFTRSDNLRRHQKNSCKLVVKRVGESSGVKRAANGNEGPAPKKHAKSLEPRIEKCDACNVDIPTNQMHAHLRTLRHKANACVIHSDGVQLIKSAFKCRIASYRVCSDKHHIDYITFFDAIQCKLIKLLETVLAIHNSVKVNMEVFATYVLHSQEVGEVKSFNTTNRIIDVSTDLNGALAQFRDAVMSQTTEFEGKDSGTFIIKLNREKSFKYFSL